MKIDENGVLLCTFPKQLTQKSTKTARGFFKMDVLIDTAIFGCAGAIPIMLLPIPTPFKIMLMLFLVGGIFFYFNVSPAYKDQNAREKIQEYLLFRNNKEIFVYNSEPTIVPENIITDYFNRLAEAPETYEEKQRRKMEELEREGLEVEGQIKTMVRDKRAEFSAIPMAAMLESAHQAEADGNTKKKRFGRKKKK